VLLLTAETGCGKSTQVPQILNRDYKKILVVQPRRESVETNAIKVAEEMNTQL
jgi:HrpA-like RNA helicase